MNISTKKGTKKKVEESKKRKFESFRQSESSCERRRRAQKLKNDLEDGLQLWSQQVYFVKDNQNFLRKLYLKIYQRQKFKLRCENSGAGGSGAQHAEGRGAGG